MNNPDEEYLLIMERLKHILEQKNMSKYALAKATKMSTSSVNSLMNGKTKPYLYTLLLICETLEVPIVELFEHESDRDSTEDWIINAYRSMSSEKRKMLNVYVDMLVQYKGNT